MTPRKKHSGALVKNWLMFHEVSSSESEDAPQREPLCNPRDNGSLGEILGASLIRQHDW